MTARAAATIAAAADNRDRPERRGRRSRTACDDTKARSPMTRLIDPHERLTEVERDQTHPNLRPRDAATLILVDRSGPVPKVLLGRRHAGTSSCPASSCFPAAGWSPATGGCRSRAPLDPHAEARLMRKRAAAERGQGARALRSPPSARPSRRPGCCLGAMRADAIRRRRRPVGGFRRSARASPTSARSAFHRPRDHAAGRPRRFDTRFFAADASADRPPDRGHRRSRSGTGRTGLAADRRGEAPRHAAHHARWCSKNCRRASRRASATTCRCRSTGCCTDVRVRELL